ncbi:MAG: hypothetical protein J7M26_08765, partial [Armatimonadetes bacterium]|nr:hypothetical protein [Armatimonadota bacterium]
VFLWRAPDVPVKYLRLTPEGISKPCVLTGTNVVLTRPQKGKKSSGAPASTAARSAAGLSAATKKPSAPPKKSKAEAPKTDARLVEGPLLSKVPPAAAWLDEHTLLLATAQDQDSKRSFRYQLRTFAWSAEAGETGELSEKSWRWVEGPKGRYAGTRRPVLLVERPQGKGAAPRVYYMVVGMAGGKRDASCFYVAMTIADRSVQDGWLIKRYYDEWTRTQSPIAATWWKDDIVVACRWFGDAPAFKHNELFCAWHGLGLNDEPMGDHDDISFIADYGVARSILYLGTIPAAPLPLGARHGGPPQDGR